MSETDRLEAFSDGVMAVIITIMAFEIKPPGGPTLMALRADAVPLLVYILSFAFIGIYWNNHHHLFRATDRLDGAVMWANLHVLFWLSLLPIVTGWVAQFPGSSLPAACYGLVALAAAAAYWMLVRTIIAANGTDSKIAGAIGSDAKGKISLVVYAAGAALAFATPIASYVLYAGVAFMWFVPDRRLSASLG